METDLFRHLYTLIDKKCNYPMYLPCCHAFRFLIAPVFFGLPLAVFLLVSACHNLFGCLSSPIRTRFLNHLIRWHSIVFNIATNLRSTRTISFNSYPFLWFPHIHGSYFAFLLFRGVQLCKGKFRFEDCVIDCQLCLGWSLFSSL